MTNEEIRNAISTLTANVAVVEEMYIENGGEMTAETEAIEADNEALRDLLTTDGVDSLGRWLKSLEDERETYKAEQAMVARRVNAVTASIDYVKGRIAKILAVTGQDKVKGSYYSFSRYTSTKNSVNTDALDRAYLEAATAAVRAAGVPSFVSVQLKATATGILDYAKTTDPTAGIDFVLTDESDAVRFTKPRKAEKETEDF